MKKTTENILVLFIITFLLLVNVAATKMMPKNGAVLLEESGSFERFGPTNIPPPGSSTPVDPAAIYKQKSQKYEVKVPISGTIYWELDYEITDNLRDQFAKEKRCYEDSADGYRNPLLIVQDSKGERLDIHSKGSKDVEENEKLTFVVQQRYGTTRSCGWWDVRGYYAYTAKYTLDMILELPEEKCGNGHCKEDENCKNCPEDCSCDKEETCNPSNPDANSWGCVTEEVCGDGECKQDENCKNCPKDCPCDKEETCNPSNPDANSWGCVTEEVCGDGECKQQDENCKNCWEDCPCDEGETCNPSDPYADEYGCVVKEDCGNGYCEENEDCKNCWEDCPCDKEETCNPSSPDANSWGCVREEGVFFVSMITVTYLDSEGDEVSQKGTLVNPCDPDSISLDAYDSSGNYEDTIVILTTTLLRYDIVSEIHDGQLYPIQFYIPFRPKKVVTPPVDFSIMFIRKNPRPKNIFAGGHEVAPNPEGMNRPGWYHFGVSGTGDVVGNLGIVFDGGTQSSNGSVDGCFIATAAYGTETAEEIDILRDFRDDVLLQNTVGEGLVNLYYEISPPLADSISKHDSLRLLVREIIVNPIVEIFRSSECIWG